MVRALPVWVVLCLLTTLAEAAPQDAPGAAQSPAALPAPIAFKVATSRRKEALPYVVQLPAGFAADRAFPLLVLVPDGDSEAAARAAIDAVGRVVAEAGFVVVSPALAATDATLPELFAQLRQTYRIDQGAMHAAGGGKAAPDAIRLVQRNSHEFQTLTLWGATAAAEDTTAVLRLHERRVRVLATPTASALRDHFAALHAERAEKGVAADVALTLDDFHDAAAKGDEDRYFAILPDDAVFLGTDPTERWTGAHFRKFAMPWFERGPAWTYVPLRRAITVGPGGAIAWFDETLDNNAYGECRGTGVLALRGGRWVLQQYNLTVPVPNDLMRSVAERIRAFVAGRAPTATTIVVVRHAEKAGSGDDPGLSEAGVVRAVRLAETLAGLDVAAVYATEWKRTVETAGPLCQSRRLQPQIVPAADTAALAARLRRDNPGRAAVVVGHSNTVPSLLEAFGMKGKVEIAETEYDRLFVVSIAGDDVRVIPLRYGTN